MKKAVFPISLVALLILGSIGWHEYHQRVQASALTKCNPIGDEACPSPQFLVGFDRLQELNDEIVKAETSPAQQQLDSKKHEAVGLVNELRAALPQGYDFNADTRKFVKSKQPPAAPAPEKK